MILLSLKMPAVLSPSNVISSVPSKRLQLRPFSAGCHAKLVCQAEDWLNGGADS